HQRARFDLGRRRERMSPDFEADARVGDVLNEHRQNAIVAAAGRRGDALGDLALHEQHGAPEDRALIEEMKQDRRRQVIRKVAAHHDPLTVCGGREIERLGIRFGDLDPWQLRPQDRNQLAIALHRYDPRAGGGKGACEVAESGTELDHRLARAQFRERGERVEERWIAEEVLPPVFLGAQSMAPQQLGRPFGHRCHPGSGARVGGARSPWARRWAPAIAIIAPLSVHSRGGGTYSPIPSSAARSAASARSREFAATPPQTTSVASRAARAARTARRVSASQTASWKEAQRSASS